MKSKFKNLKNLISLTKKAYFNKKQGLHDPLFSEKEKKFLSDCINSGYVSSVGKYVKLFEKKISDYTGSNYSIATNSGTSALHLSLVSLGVNSNHEILLPSLTYIATANAVKYCGATPNFLDIEEENYGVCPKKLKKYLTKTTFKKKGKIYNKLSKKQIKALIIVHLYGISSKILELRDFCKKNKIFLIEDAAEAVGTFFQGKHLGTFGDLGILSFNGNKTITTGSGGMVITNNRKLARKIYHLSTQAKKNSKQEHYHDEVGFNYRMSNISAAIGCAQIDNIKQILRKKRRMHSRFTRFFNNKVIEVIKEPQNCKSNYWLIIGLLKNFKQKNNLIKKLRDKGIVARSVWRPIHKLPIFQKCPKDNLNNSNKFFKKAISFPNGPKI